MFLPWSILGRAPQNPNHPRPKRTKSTGMKGSKRRKPLDVEALEDRTLLATFFVDITNTNPGNDGLSPVNLGTGTLLDPYINIQAAIRRANLNPGHDDIVVYGNNSNNPAMVYTWDRDADLDFDGIPDGNMVISNNGIVGNTLNITFLAQTSAGAPAPLIVKMLNNIVDVGDGCQLRIEGNSTFRVIFTSLPDDTAGGDTNNDGNINAPNRADWGGIRFRPGAVGQGANNPALGSIVNWADIRYTGQSLFDPTVLDFTEFAAVRMEADINSGQRVAVRVWNTVIRHGGRAIDVNIWSLAGRGPDLGFNASGAAGLGPQPLTFQNNSINGAFISIPFITNPFDPRFGQVIQLDQDARLDDVGVPYVLTQRFVLANNVTLTIDPAIIVKLQRVTIDTKDAADVTDSTSGTLIVNGLPERPVLFTSVNDDNIFIPGTILNQFYNNGTADTNNDGNATTPQPGDWAGIRVSQGNIDYAHIRYAGGLYPLQGTFVNSPAVQIFSQDRTGLGGVIETFRISNSVITQTFTGFVFGTFYDSPAIDVFSRDWNPNIQRTGDISIIDNFIHTNQGKAANAHPMAFHDRRNPTGGYGVNFRRNIIENNANNSVYIRFELDLARGIDRNISRVGGYFDDSDIVHTLDGQLLAVHANQAFQIMSRRGVEPSPANGGFLDRFQRSQTQTDNQALQAFLNGLVMRLPGIPNIPLERGPNSPNANPSLVDSGLFYYLINFEDTARGLGLVANPQANPGNLYGDEWRDWGINLTTGAIQALKPFYIRGNIPGDSDPLGAPVSGNNMLAVSEPNGNGSLDLTFPNAVSAVGFWIIGNDTTSPNERIEFIGVDGNLIESIPMPTTTPANNRAFIGRISKQPIWKVRIVEDANDNVGGTFDYTGPAIIIPDGGQIAATLNVGSSFTISDVNVNLNIIHPRVSDLRVQLRGPDGTTIDLVNRTPAPLATGANFTNTYFDDQSAYSINFGLAPYTGSFKPVQSLSAFNGKNSLGNWQVIVTDLAAGPGGTAALQNFSLTFQSPDLVKDTIAIDDLYYVEAPQALVLKSASIGTTLTAGAVEAGYANVTQDATGIINSGLVHDGHSITITGSGNTARGVGNGGTIRVLGQYDTPVIMTSLFDNTVGAGVVGHVQFNTTNDPFALPSPGDWRGIQIHQGANSSKSYVETQQATGSITRRYADLNPYTLGDEGPSYLPGAESHMDLVLPNGLLDLIPGAAQTRVMIQDGVLIEHADIRYALIGIDHVGFPENKITIDANELEQDATQRANPNGSRYDAPTNRINPLGAIITNDSGQVRFDTTSGAYRVGARMGGTSENPLTGTDDVDWFELPRPEDYGQNSINFYIDVQRGNATSDGPGGPFGIAVFNSGMQLLWISYSGLAQVAGNIVGATAGQLANSGNALGAVTALAGDIPHSLTNPQYDAHFVAIFPLGRFPRLFIPQTLGGQLSTGIRVVLTPLPGTGPVGSNGFRVVSLIDQEGAPQDIPPTSQNQFIDNPGPDGAFLGGYEVEFRTAGFQDRSQRPVRAGEGEYIYRQNIIQESLLAALTVRDHRQTRPSNLNQGETLPSQTARFAQDNNNLVINTNGVPFNNLDYFIPGIYIANNLIVNNRSVGVYLEEDNSLPGANLTTPTNYTTIINNTFDGNGGTAIDLRTRGGVNVLNNLITNNAIGLNITKLPDIEPLRPPILAVVAYNLFFNNSTHITPSSVLNGSNNLLNTNPLYVDRQGFDFRIQVGSPAVDSAISNVSDRLAATRFPQEPTRAPGDDIRGRARVDNPTRPNVGAGQFPFYDRGAYEASEPPLRVIGVNVVSANQLLGQPVSQLVVTFYGRVDITTVNASTVRLQVGSFAGPLVGIGPISQSYDPVSNKHTFIIPLQQTLIDGVYALTLKGTSTGASDPGIRDISGNLLDGEFPPPYTFPSGNGIAGGSFLYVFSIRTATIGGLVWNNPNGNLTQDPGEPGLPNVGVEMTWAGPDGVFGTPDDGSPITQNTNLNGNFSFVGLQPGNYRINVLDNTLPASFFLNTPPDPKFVTLAFGENLTGVNFGYWQDFSNATLGNLAWNDLNGDGIRQASEPVMAGIIINALWAGRDGVFGNADDEVFTTTSDLINSGNWRFQNILPAGNYQVTVDMSSVPAGFQRTTYLGAGEYPVLKEPLLPGEQFNQIRFGFQQKSAVIGDTVFNDLNGNGVQDPGEPGLANVQVILNGPGGPQNTLTDVNGNYSFANLAAGTYTISVNTATIPANFYATTPNPRTVILPDGVTVDNTADFGFRADPFLGIIGSFVWHDINGNGAQDPGEPGLSNVEIIAQWAGRDGVFGTGDDQNFTTFTDPNGNYALLNLPVGFYRVNTGTGVPLGFGRTFPAVVPIAVTIGDGIGGNPGPNFLNANFGFQAANASISGVVFQDLNGNGILDAVPNETGRFSNVRVFVDLNNNNAWDIGEPFAVSAPVTGAWTISGLASGTFKVMIDPLQIPGAPPGLVASPAFLNVVVPPSANVTGQNLGLWQRNSIVTGRVFNDANMNGAIDFGEQGIAGAFVTLVWYGSNNVFENGGGDDQIFTAFTDASGQYTFSNLPGAFVAGNNYRIFVDTNSVPPGSNPTIPNPPLVDFNLGASATRTQNFGFLVPPSLLPGIYYLSVSGVNSLQNSDGSLTLVNDSDIVKLRTQPNGDYRYDVYFRGSNFGLTPGVEGIDAFTILRDGSILISTVGNMAVFTNYAAPGVGSGAIQSGFGEDIFRFVPASFSGGTISSGVWNLAFRGSRVGLSGTRGNVVAVAALYNPANQVDRLLLSTAGQVTVSGVVANNFDVIQFSAITFGPNTNGIFYMYLKGSNVGLNDTINENIDGINAVQPASGWPTLQLSTTGSFSVPGLSGGRSDIFQFNPIVYGNGTAGTWGPSLLLGDNVGLTNANITDFFVGQAPGDPSPLYAAGAAAGREADLDTQVIRWASETSSVNVFIDSSSFTTDQVDRVRDAMNSINGVWQRVSGMRLVEVAHEGEADIRVSMKDASTLGDKAAGLLGQVNFVYDTALSGVLADGRMYRTFIGHQFGGQATVDIISGWNWYNGIDAKAIGRGQYDFQSVVTHELGHLLGLPENRMDPTQVMFEALRPGQVRRAFGFTDATTLARLYNEQRTAPIAETPRLDGNTLAQLANLVIPPSVARMQHSQVDSLVRDLTLPLIGRDGQDRSKQMADYLFTRASATNGSANVLADLMTKPLTNLPTLNG